MTRKYRSSDRTGHDCLKFAILQYGDKYLKRGIILLVSMDAMKQDTTIIKGKKGIQGYAKLLAESHNPI